MRFPHSLGRVCSGIVGLLVALARSTATKFVDAFYKLQKVLRVFIHTSYSVVSK